MKKLLFIALLCAVMASPAFGTDIFGEGRAFSALFNDENVDVELDFKPLVGNAFYWGPRLQGKLDPALNDRARWKETLVGVGVKYPVITFNSSVNLPIEGRVIAGADALCDTRDFDEWYASYSVGALANIPENPNLQAYVRYRYMDRSDVTSDSRHTVMIGFMLEWKD